MWRQFIRNNFTLFATGSLVASMVSGYMGLAWIEKKQAARQQQQQTLDHEGHHDHHQHKYYTPSADTDSKHDANNNNNNNSNNNNNNNNNNKLKSRQEFRLQAMVENALQSTWKQNLDNATKAHERFMLPGRPHERLDNFENEIDRRCNELMLKQQQQQQQREQAKQQEQDKIQFWKS